MTRPSPDVALEQYLETLKLSGVSTKQLTLARHFLRHLMSTLRDLPQDGHGYRKASELTLRNFPADEQFRSFVREFFPYWNGEAAPPPKTSQPSLAPTEASLLAAMQKMEADPWAQTSVLKLEQQLHQLKCLQRYAEELKKAGLEDANVQLRARLIKLLLFHLREATPNTESYRAGVDKLLAMLPSQERWHVFVSLAREFFYFLASDPEAGSKLQRQLSTADLQGLLAA
ncbi:hypothetical protein [Chitinimonas taiwanensis]|jgi:hypothetical protein|uniref:hypothetical protein n=1 Tax=Chitinimonas taiwanensis TaxID=240412 RepID=UPI0035B2251D